MRTYIRCHVWVQKAAVPTQRSLSRLISQAVSVSPTKKPKTLCTVCVLPTWAVVCPNLCREAQQRTVRRLGSPCVWVHKAAVPTQRSPQLSDFASVSSHAEILWYITDKLGPRVVGLSEFVVTDRQQLCRCGGAHQDQS